MKNKKGFTLIELLAVIVVLAIIMIIATISVNKQIKKSRKNANDINKKMIVKAYNMCMTQENDLEKLKTLFHGNDKLKNWIKNNYPIYRLSKEVLDIIDGKEV